MANPNPTYKFPKGQSGNPRGRPKGSSITTKLRDLLKATDLDGKPIPKGKTVGDILSEVILREALKGDINFVKLVVQQAEYYVQLDEIQKTLDEIQSVVVVIPDNGRDPPRDQTPAGPTSLPGD